MLISVVRSTEDHGKVPSATLKRLQRGMIAMYGNKRYENRLRRLLF